ncbi:3982_t:CDS:2, partial [Ambispora leptoticha]
QFEKIAFANPSNLRMILIKGRLEIMPPVPVHFKFGQKQMEIIGQVYNWCCANKSLVGHTSSSRCAFRLLNLEDPNDPNKNI